MTTIANVDFWGREDLEALKKLIAFILCMFGFFSGLVLFAIKRDRGA